MSELDEKNKVKNELNLRSEEIKDIMSKSPMWVVRWGISTVFVIILAGVLVSWFMKYPDIIKGKVSVTHLNPPVKIISPSNGNLVAMYAKEGQTIDKGTLIAELENPLSASSVNKLKQYITKLESAMAQGKGILPLPTEQTGSLGDLQSTVNQLQNDIREYNLRGSYKLDDREMQGLENQLGNERRLGKINNDVLKLAQDDYVSAKVRFDADKSLYDSKVLSRADFIQSQSQFNQKKMQLERAKLASIQNNINISTIQTRVDQIRYSKASKDKSGFGTILGHIESIKSYLYGWRQQNTLVAPVTGRLSYLSPLRSGMHVKFDEPLFAVIRPDNKFVAHGYVPVMGAGKVKIGQDVSILLDNFPYHEYGVVVGKVKFVAAIPTDNTYRVEIELPQGLLSTYGDTLMSSPEMLGDIEIVTEDKRVLQRIMHSILKIFETR